MIPYGRQDITKGDIKSVVKVLNSDFLTQGPCVPLFESNLCSYAGAKYSVVVNSATSALHIACLSLGLGKGDILWTSPISFVASANCALYCGASVDFVDVDPNTALMDVDKLEEKLKQSEKTKSLPKIVIPVHFSGQPCDLKKIYKLGKRYGFKIIEDAAHAIGAKYNNRLIGDCLYSDITVFSFHPVKIITSGEGGAAMTNNSLYAKKMSLLRSHGISRDSNNIKNNNLWYYEQLYLGFNYRMNDINAALGISQLKRINQYISKRKKIVKFYNSFFKKSALIFPIENKSYAESSHHLYVVRIVSDKNVRDVVYNSLISLGIGVNVHYIPIYKQPYFSNKHKPLQGAEEYFKNSISLPLHPKLSLKDMNFIATSLVNIVNKVA